MTSSDLITIVGTIVTIIATAITIQQAWTARNARRDLDIAVSKVKLSANAERLRAAQAHIRDLPSSSPLPRGSNPKFQVARIRQEFDTVLGSLSKSGLAGEARKLVAEAQMNLNIYEDSISKNINHEAWTKLQIQVQDSISELTTAISSAEKNK